MTCGMPSLKAMTVCLWMKTADTENEGTPLSYAVSGSTNELVLYNYRNFALWLGNGHRYKPATFLFKSFLFALSLRSMQSCKHKNHLRSIFLDEGNCVHGTCLKNVSFQED